MRIRICVFSALVILLPFAISAEEANCMDSLKLGIADAALDHKPWNWYFVGIGTGLAVAGSLFLTDELYYEYPELDNAIWATARIAQYSVYIPAFFSPRREKIEPPIGQVVDIECYREGFKRRAKWKNAGAVFLGQSTAAVVAVIVLLRDF